MTKSQVSLHDSPLYKMLVERLPTEYLRPNGRLDMLKITQKVGYSQQSVYRWMLSKNFNRKGIKALVALSNDTDEVEKKGLIKAEDLYPFMMQS